jgi:hypothetical protein
MSNKYPCSLIQDLLPLYHDSVCAGETRAAVEDHLQDCQSCQAAYQALLQSDKVEPDCPEPPQAEAIRQVRGRFRRRAMALCLTVLVVMTLVFTAVIVWMNTSTVLLPKDMVKATGTINKGGEKAYRFWFRYDSSYGSRYYVPGRVVTFGGDVTIDGKQERVLVFSRRITVWESAWYDLTATEEEKAPRRNEMEYPSEAFEDVIPVAWKDWNGRFYGNTPPAELLHEGYIFDYVYFAPDCTLLEGLEVLTAEQRGELLAEKAVLVSRRPYLR